MKVESFQVKNFRSFSDTGKIRLKPINLLIGKNSIGKSSFARIWPLLRQGTKLEKRSPVVWNGELVDFGSFQETICRYSHDNDEITFIFTLSASAEEIGRVRAMYRVGRVLRYLNDEEINVEISLVSIRDGMSTTCPKLVVSVGELSFSYSLNDAGVFTSITYKKETLQIPEYFKAEPTVGFLLPNNEFFVNDPESSALTPAYSPMYMQLFDYLRANLHGRIASRKVHEICMNLNVIGTADSLLKYCRTLNYEYNSWRILIDKLSDSRRMLGHFHKLVTLAATGTLISEIDFELRSHFGDVNYIKPLRATANRYYRRQELSVSNIDSKGENLPFFLESLPKAKFEKFNDWLAECLDMKVEVSREHGHVMLRVQDLSTGRTDNIADMGFGYSQVLPLAAQAWISAEQASTGRRRITNGSNILVWEQPELHLHPAMQRKLARLIVKSIGGESNSRLNFVIETHSQSILNEVGDLMVDGDIASDDVQVLIFEQSKNGDTTIRSTQFDEDGQLIDWPIGFLAV